MDLCTGDLGGCHNAVLFASFITATPLGGLSCNAESIYTDEAQHLCFVQASNSTKVNLDPALGAMASTTAINGTSCAELEAVVSLGRVLELLAATEACCSVLLCSGSLLCG
jgi:hypothetical protein